MHWKEWNEMKEKEKRNEGTKKACNNGNNNKIKLHIELKTKKIIKSKWKWNWKEIIGRKRKCLCAVRVMQALNDVAYDIKSYRSNNVDLIPYLDSNRYWFFRRKMERNDMQLQFDFFFEFIIRQNYQFLCLYFPNIDEIFRFPICTMHKIGI